MTIKCLQDWFLCLIFAVPKETKEHKKESVPHAV